MEKILAPYLFGALVGFIAFYFIRKYKDYTPQSLKFTLGIMALNFILPSIMAFIDVEFLYRYLIGVAVGVLIYLIYLISIMRFKEKGWISNFEGYASCGMDDDELDTLDEVNQSIPETKEEK